MVVIDGQIYWYRLILVSFTDTLAFNTKYRYLWLSNINTSIDIAEAETPILVSVSLKKYGIAHICIKIKYFHMTKDYYKYKTVGKDEAWCELGFTLFAFIF